MKITLRDYQEYGINWCVKTLEEQDGVLLSDEMGLGKTIMSAHVASNFNKVLIITPSFLVMEWHRKVFEEYGLFKNEVFDILAHGGEKRPPNSDARVVFSTYTMYPFFNKFDNNFYDITIFDEVHYLKSSQSRRGNFFLKEFRNTKKRMGLTGTPFGNSIVDLYNILYTVNRKFMRSQMTLFNFMEEYSKNKTTR